MSQDSYGVIAEFDVEATMRDGVVLRANVYRPQAEGPFPVILARTLCSKDVVAEYAYHGFDPVFLARSGFMAVIQDVRGRYCSDGEWEPFRHEREDGYDSVQWVAALPGANGRVGMFGASYVGGTQWASAIAGAPALKAIAPLFTWAKVDDGVVARGRRARDRSAVLLVALLVRAACPRDVVKPLVPRPRLLLVARRPQQVGHGDSAGRR